MAGPADQDHRLQTSLAEMDARLNQRLEVLREAQDAELFARHDLTTSGDWIATAPSSHLATRMTCARDASGALACVARAICGSADARDTKVLALRSNPTRPPAGQEPERLASTDPAIPIASC